MGSNNKACLLIELDSIGTKNRPFDTNPSGEGMKNMLYPFRALRERLSNYNIELSTKDINSPESSKFVFCLDCPKLMPLTKGEDQIWCLIIYDPPIYIPEVWNKNNHSQFDYVFTFDSTLVDNKKYFFYPFAIDTDFFSIPKIVEEGDFNNKILATIVSNSIHKLQDKKNAGSLIHRRYDTIWWYGKNHPNDFNFYGGRTFYSSYYYMYFKGISIVKKIIPDIFFRKFAKYFQRPFIRVYKGQLPPLEKFKTIGNYRFYYCYENTSDINGYVTEKLFDCLYTGIVPVYWGAPNVKELIPYDCYINGFDFDTEENLYGFLKNMAYKDYRKYLEQAQLFLKSREMEKFTVKYFTECILSPIKPML
jgi:alpha(1,3/1,4) fucosyltransferase